MTAELFVYDDGCGPCSRFVALMRPRVDEGMRFVGRRSYRGPGEELSERTALLVAGERVHVEHEAIGGLLRHAGRPWCWLGGVILWPPLRGVGRAVYRRVAAARHRLPVGACTLER